MIKNEFTTLSEEDALKFIELHLEESFIVSACKNRIKPRRLVTDHGIWPTCFEYIIVATKEDQTNDCDVV